MASERRFYLPALTPQVAVNPFRWPDMLRNVPPRLASVFAEFGSAGRATQPSSLARSAPGAVPAQGAQPRGLGLAQLEEGVSEVVATLTGRAVGPQDPLFDAGYVTVC